MKLLTSSRLFGVLLIAASLPLDPSVALAVSHALTPADRTNAPAALLEERMRRIAIALLDAEVGASDTSIGQDAMSWWNGGFRNGGFRNGGFRNGGFWNGGFRNGGFRNGGFRNGGGVFVNF